MLQSGDKAMVLCFVEFMDSKCAVTAMEALNGRVIIQEIILMFLSNILENSLNFYLLLFGDNRKRVLIYSSKFIASILFICNIVQC